MDKSLFNINRAKLNESTTFDMLDDSDKSKVEEFYKTLQNECSDILEHYRNTRIAKNRTKNIFLRRTAVTKTFVTYENRLRERVKGSIDRLYMYTHYVLPYMKGSIDRRYTYYMTYGNLNDEMTDEFGENLYVLFPTNETKFNMLKEDFNMPHAMTDIIKEVFEDIIRLIRDSYNIIIYGYNIPMMFISMPYAYYVMLKRIKGANSNEHEKITKVVNTFVDIMDTFGYDITRNDFEFMDTGLYLEKNYNDLRDIEKAGDMIDSVYAHANKIFFDLLDDLKNSSNQNIVEFIDNVRPYKDQIINSNIRIYEKTLRYFKSTIIVSDSKKLPTNIVMDEVYAQGKSYGINFESPEFEYLLELINNG